MKMSYYAETDSLYIDLAERPSADSREVSPGIVMDFDAEGRIVGIDIDQTRNTLALDRLELYALPLGKVTLSA